MKRLQEKVAIVTGASSGFGRAIAKAYGSEGAKEGAAANLTRCLAIEYGRDKIRVNGICPTYCKTALTRAFYDDKGFDTMFVESIPLHRLGEAKDVADLAVFLASDESAYIHGDLIKLDGGEQLCRYSV